MAWILQTYFPRAEIVRDLIFLCALLLVWFVPGFLNPLFARIEHVGSRLAQRKVQAVFAVVLAAIVLRLCLLWLVPVPYPRIHDEFSYLLGGDTFAHGRLTNPPHPMSIFFDTIHVNQHPTYQSKYPPAQAAVLALGQLVGSPWIGVLLSTAAMCGVMVWMMQGWFPPRWALLGGTLVLLRLGIFSYWMNSYWGGSVPALGGALVVGALPRLVRHWRARDSLILALGAFILVNSRPFEGFVLCVPVLIAVLVKLAGSRRPPLAAILPRVLLPFCAVAIVAVGFFCYYNWRGTGHAMLPPYVVNERTYFSTPSFVWQSPKPPLHYANAQLDRFYNDWCRLLWSNQRVTGVASAARVTLSTSGKAVFFFLWPELCLPLFALLCFIRDKRIRFLSIQAVIGLGALLLVSWFEPHYIGPLTATCFALLLQGMRHLRRWKSGGRPVGVGLTRMVIVFCALYAVFNVQNEKSPFDEMEKIGYRAQFIRQLGRTPGKHLVVVRYSPRHTPLREWVYNDADIDNSQVVWAREIPGVDMKPLFDYFRGREVWVVDPDAAPPRLAPYSAPPN